MREVKEKLFILVLLWKKMMDSIEEKEEVSPFFYFCWLVFIGLIVFYAIARCLHFFPSIKQF